ncbi:MAG: NrsF family protein [Geminicoccaceae bacterium]
MLTTSDLVAALAADAKPVRRLRPPTLRAALWLLLAGLLVLALAVLLGLRPDLAEHLRQPVFAVMLLASLSTGALAAVTAFHLSLPDRSRRWLWLPVPAFLLWVSSIGYGCLTDWVRIAPDSIVLGSTLQCFATALIVCLPLSLALLLMLRHAVWLDPVPVAMAGGLALAGVSATALSLLHPLDATVMVLLWNLGLAALMVALAGRFGRWLFAWAEPRSMGG